MKTYRTSNVIKSDITSWVEDSGNGETSGIWHIILQTATLCSWRLATVNEIIVDFNFIELLTFLLLFDCDSRQMLE